MRESILVEHSDQVLAEAFIINHNVPRIVALKVRAWEIILPKIWFTDSDQIKC